MKLLSELISKKVLNLYSGKLEGLVIDALFDDKYQRIVKLKLSDFDEEEFEISTKNIYSVSDIVNIKNNAHITSLINKNEDKYNNPILKDVYSVSGNYYGKIIDIKIADNFKVDSFLTEVLTFTPRQIVNLKDNIIINTTNKKIKLSNFKPARTFTSLLSSTPQQDKVTILAPQIENLEQTNPNYTLSPLASPPKIIGNNDFLLGRKADKNIYSLNNELIIKKDSQITKKHLELAKRHGKLAELTIYSKKA